MLVLNLIQKFLNEGFQATFSTFKPLRDAEYPTPGMNASCAWLHDTFLHHFSESVKKKLCYSFTTSITELRDQGHSQLTRRRTEKAECPAHEGVKVTAVTHHYNLLSSVQILRDVLQQEEHRLGPCDLRTLTKNKRQHEPEHFNMWYGYGLSHTRLSCICSIFGTRCKETPDVNRRIFEKMAFWAWEHGKEHSMSTMEMIRALMKSAPFQFLAQAS